MSFVLKRDFITILMLVYPLLYTHLSFLFDTLIFLFCCDFFPLFRFFSCVILVIILNLFIFAVFIMSVSTKEMDSVC